MAVKKAKEKKVQSAEADALLSSQSFSGMQQVVQNALCNVLNGRAADDDGDGDGTMPMNSVYSWVRDIYTDKVVYSVDGEMYQRDYQIDAQGNVTFGDPIEVEIAYQPTSESHRFLAPFGISLKEAGASFNSKTGELTLTIIKPGLNTSKSRYYPPTVLKRDMGIFENAKMFADHQTTKEAADRPEGSVNNWVAQLGKPWSESDGSIKAKAKVIDPPFKEKLDSLQKAGLLHEMGVSIRAVGVGSEADVPDGSGTVKANMVERLLSARSVDFVTFPGAGGHCEVLESDQSNEFDIELVTLEQLKERRQDLVELIESNAREDVARMKTLEQQLHEANAALAAEKDKAKAIETKLAESETAGKKRDVATKLKELLEASKLPEKAKERITAQFKEAVSTDGMEAAIQAEKDYITSLGVVPGGTGGSTKVTNLGARANGAEEADKDKPKVNLVESFKALGLTEDQAKIAAAGR